MKRYRLNIRTVVWLLGVLFLTACQHDVFSGEGTNVGSQPTDYPDSSYINLRIVNSPTGATRATEDATAQENAIYDGIICLFEGTSEATATLKTASAIDQLINNPGADGLPELDITQRIDTKGMAAGTKLYVLVLLNTLQTGFHVGGTNEDELLFDDDSQQGKTIGQIRDIVIHGVGSTQEHVGLFMTNAPQEGFVMPEVTGSYLSTPGSTVAAASRLTVHVERTAAKVRVTNGATTVTTFCLDNNPSRRPTVHRMAWALDNYNTRCFALRNGYTSAQNWSTSITGAGIPIAFDASTPDDFHSYGQRALQDGETAYVAENTSGDGDKQTKVIIEVQLKEGSFLLGNCYRYQLWGTDIFFTSAEKFIQYCKDGWKTTFASMNSEQLKTKSAEEIFKYTSLTINDDGTVTVRLKNDSFTAEEKTALNNLATTLSNTLTGYHDGKMYFIYKIYHNDTYGYGVVRNNAYHLMFNNVPGIGGAVPVH